MAPDLDFDETISLGIYQGTKNLLETFAAANDYLAAKGDAVANAAIDAANVILDVNLLSQLTPLTKLMKARLLQQRAAYQT